MEIGHGSADGSVPKVFGEEAEMSVQVYDGDGRKPLTLLWLKDDPDLTRNWYGYFGDKTVRLIQSGSVHNPWVWMYDDKRPPEHIEDTFETREEAEAALHEYLETL